MARIRAGARVWSRSRNMVGRVREAVSTGAFVDFDLDHKDTGKSLRITIVGHLPGTRFENLRDLVVLDDGSGPTIEPLHPLLALAAERGDHASMSAANEQTGFMGRPASTSVTTVDELTAPPAPPPSSDRIYHWAYSMPESVADQYHWRGTAADLHYGLIEPSLEDLAKIGRDPDRQVRDIAVGFVRALGQLDGQGNLVLDAQGLPKLRPVGYMEVEAWFGRIGPKGAQLVVGEFQSLFQPSKAEGEAHRASRRRG